jgi:release factor glutamine methyltransferase
MTISLHPEVYVPEADTYFLCETALIECRSGERVLEVGTGSGYIAARLSEKACVLATDISPHAVREAYRAGVAVVRTDLFAGICTPFDLVVFNPPYLPTREEERLDDWLEYALDGGEDGRQVIQRFSREVRRILGWDGRILLLISSLTGLPEVMKLFENEGFDSEILDKRTVFDEELYILRIRRKPGT